MGSPLVLAWAICKAQNQHQVTCWETWRGAAVWRSANDSSRWTHLMAPQRTLFVLLNSCCKLGIYCMCVAWAAPYGRRKPSHVVHSRMTTRKHWTSPICQPYNKAQKTKEKSCPNSLSAGQHTELSKGPLQSPHGSPGSNARGCSRSTTASYWKTQCASCQPCYARPVHFDVRSRRERTASQQLCRNLCSVQKGTQNVLEIPQLSDLLLPEPPHPRARTDPRAMGVQCCASAALSPARLSAHLLPVAGPRAASQRLAGLTGSVAGGWSRDARLEGRSTYIRQQQAPGQPKGHARRVCQLRQTPTAQADLPQLKGNVGFSPQRLQRPLQVFPHAYPRPPAITLALRASGCRLHKQERGRGKGAHGCGWRTAGAAEGHCRLLAVHHCTGTAQIEHLGANQFESYRR